MKVAIYSTAEYEKPFLEKLNQQGVQLIALRSAGYDHVDLSAAKMLNITVVNAPTYSPSAVAEHATIGCFGMDVYENEKSIFFKDHSGESIDDELFGQLRKMTNVVITGHQAFFTEEALANIANTTFENIQQFFNGQIQNQVSV